MVVLYLPLNKKNKKVNENRTRGEGEGKRGAEVDERGRKGGNNILQLADRIKEQAPPEAFE